MLALAAASSLAKLLQSEIHFNWAEEPRCKCGYHEVFGEMPGLMVDKRESSGYSRIETGWKDPAGIFKGFEEALHVQLSEEVYYYQFLESLRDLNYSEYVRVQLSRCLKKRQGYNNLAIHIRRTDRINHHKKVYKHGFDALNIIRNTGIKKSIQYLFLPESVISQLENRYFTDILKKNLSNFPDSTYSLYCDSQDELEHTLQYFRNAGIPDQPYFMSYCADPKNKCWGEFGIRNTRMSDALVELLEMSNSSWIAQNNRASTFSVAAAIIGRVKIISQKPAHKFWRKIKAILGENPNTIST
jgi:hypothetical protein